MFILCAGINKSSRGDKMNTNTNQVECPKCFGSGKVAHKHVENGVCFLCGGVGTCTDAEANRWLAAQLRAHGPKTYAAPVATAPLTFKSKTVDLGAVFGQVEIRHYNDDMRGNFVAVLGSIRDGVTDEYGCPHAGYHVHFTVRAGKVQVRRDGLQNGMKHYGNNRPAMLQAALQGALVA